MEKRYFIKDKDGTFVTNCQRDPVILIGGHTCCCCDLFHGSWLYGEGYEFKNQNYVLCSYKAEIEPKAKPKSADDYEILRDCTLESLVDDNASYCKLRFFRKHINNNSLPYNKLSELFEKSDLSIFEAITYLIENKYIRLKARTPKVGDVFINPHEENYPYYIIKQKHHTKADLFVCIHITPNVLNTYDYLLSCIVKDWQYICNSEDLTAHLSKLSSEPEDKSCANCFIPTCGYKFTNRVEVCGRWQPKTIKGD